MIPVKTEWMQKQMAHQPTAEYARNIYRLAKKFKFKNGLEIGCMWGISTLALLTGSTGKLLSVDKSSYTHADEEVKTNGLESRWRFICKDSKDFWLTNETFDLIYIDGDHSYDYAHLDMQGAWEHLEDGGVMAVDDATHKNNRPNDYDPYGVSIAAVEHWYNNPSIKKVGFEGRILWFKK